jgi:hypothetical protein
MSEGRADARLQARSRGRGGGQLRCYRILGMNLVTDFEFETPLLPCDQPPDLRFRLRDHEMEPPEWTVPESTLFESPLRIDSGLPLFTVHEAGGGDLIRFSEVVDFLLTGQGIQARLLDPEYAYQVEPHLLGIVLSYWLERRGIPMLHAAAVAVSGRAVGFIGTNRGGKSSLAVSLMQRGFPLLADDLVGLELSAAGVRARPGFPSMRMWPDLAQEVLGDAWEALPLAHPRYDKRRVAVGPAGVGQFLDRVCPLKRLYLPERRDPDLHGLEVEFESLHPAEAIFQLLRGSFLPRLTLASGLATGRMQIFGALTRTVPVKRLIYPSGFEHLGEVAQRILVDLESDAFPAGGPGA